MPAFQSRSSPPISSLHAVIASRHTRVFIEKIDPFIGGPDALPMDDMEEKSRHAVLDRLSFKAVAGNKFRTAPSPRLGRINVRLPTYVLASISRRQNRLGNRVH
jgi:hypothetical protein